MPSVLQGWVSDLSAMQQSVLLTAIRGCDGLPKKHVSKFLLRWYRRCILVCAFEKKIHWTPEEPCTGNFTGPVTMPWNEIVKLYFSDVDNVPHHFHLHVVHAAEILGRKHPSLPIREMWHRFYLRAVQDMHMQPETEEQMDYRLGDVQEQWLKAGGEHEYNKVEQ